jgi:uncharacterized membrane protein required for colicin V production
MQYFLDISLILILVITIISNWQKGFTRSILGVAKTIVAILTSYLFGPPASAWVSEHLITERVTNAIYERLLAAMEAGSELVDLTTLLESLPSWMLSFFEKTGVDPSTLMGLPSDPASSQGVNLQDMAQSLAAPISQMISDMIGYTAVFLIAMILFAIVAYILGKIVELPILRQIDRTMGLVLGIFCAFIYASVYTLLVYALLTLVEGHYDSVAFHAAFEQTWLFKVFYDINVFRWMFSIG